MATLTRFEVQIPISGDTAQQAAINAFLDNIGTLCKFTSNMQYVYTSHDLSVGQYTQLIYGLITTAQQSTALGFLTTLNAALGVTVLCTINSVTSEP